MPEQREDGECGGGDCRKSLSESSRLNALDTSTTVIVRSESERKETLAYPPLFSCRDSLLMC